jgi:regulator of extracellular matrix RemA (YlzA/DUF370 family)
MSGEVLLVELEQGNIIALNRVIAILQAGTATSHVYLEGLPAADAYIIVTRTVDEIMATIKSAVTQSVPA